MRPVFSIRSVLVLLSFVSGPALAQSLVAECDRLAANPFDAGRKTAGVNFEKLDAAAAVKACRQAVQASPEPRLKYQYGRALQKADQFNEAMTWYRQAADQGYAAAQFNVGLLYAAGKGVEKNEAEAARWYRRAADQGSAVAQYHLGTFYLMGIGVEEDRNDAFQWFMKSAEQGLPSAQMLVSKSLSVGWGTDRDMKKSGEWAVKSVKAGYSGCPRVVVDRIDRDILEKNKFAHDFAKQGRAFCYQEMGDFANALKYRNLLIQETDPNFTTMILHLKIPLVQILAELGRIDEAKATLAEVKGYDWDKVGLPGKKTSIRYYEQKLNEIVAARRQERAQVASQPRAVAPEASSRSDDPLRMPYTAEQWEKDVQSNERRMTELKRNIEAEEQELAANKRELAYKEGLLAYRSGDYATALSKWRPVADQDHASAQFYLGVMYDNGRGVSRNHTEAAKWYRKAAEQGHADAQFNLGMSYYKGEGVSRDYVMAQVLFSLAAGQGHKSAMKNRDILARRLGAADLSKARQIAASWEKGTPLPTTGPSHSMASGRQAQDRGPGSLVKSQLVSLQSAVYEIFFYRQTRGDYNYRDAPLRYWEQVSDLDDARVLKCHYSTGKRDTISAGYYYWYQTVPSEFNKALRGKLLRRHPIERIDAPLTKCPGTQPATNTVLR